MQALNIDQLIELARLDPAAFEARRTQLVRHAIQSSLRPAIAEQLQAAVAQLQRDPAGGGREALRQTLETINGELDERLRANAPASAGKPARKG